MNQKINEPRKYFITEVQKLELPDTACIIVI